MSLTDKALQALKPRDKPYKLADGHGLYIEVLPSGGRSWRLKYRFGGKEKRLTLGLYPDVGLKKARDKARDARDLLDDGIDPSVAKKEIKQAKAVEAQAANVITFESVVKELLATKENRQVTARHLHDVKRSLELHVLPSFGSRDIKSITAFEVIELGRKTEAAGLYQAHRIVQRIGEVMDTAIAMGYLNSNPVVKKTHSFLKQHTKENMPAIFIEELPDFLQDLEMYRGYPTTILMLKFMLLTSCRTGEARKLLWSFVDLDKRLITIPPPLHKAGRRSISKGKPTNEQPPHLIPLSSQVIRILKSIRKITSADDADYVFPSYSNYKKKASENVISSALANIGGGTWKGRQSGHGFRRLCRTAWKESKKFDYYEMELQLGHDVLSETEKAYDDAQMIAGRADMLQWWADKVEALAGGRI